MEPKEFDIIMNEALETETRKLIQEEIDKMDNLVNSVKGFQTLSGLVDKISHVNGDDNSRIEIQIQDITPEELVSCCGGDSLGKAQTNLMQGLHHDLEENGFNDNYDIDVDTQGTEDSLGLTIKITTNDDELSNKNDMSEVTDTPKDTNPTKKDEKDMILGGDKIKEQQQEASGAMAAEEDVTEHHKHDKKSQIDFICKHDKDCKREDLEKLSDDEVEEKYLALEKKMGITESKKKVVTLTENEMASLIEKIIREAEDNPHLATPVRGVPGVDVTKKTRKDSGKENDDALKAVEKKIKDYLSFDGNDDPEFPNPVGKGEQKVATKNTESENDVVDLNRGRTPADLTYDQEPSEQFKERAKLSLVGAAEMGNSSEYANAIPSKVGEDMVKTAEKRKEARANEPIYDKEAVPVDEDSDKKDRPGPDSGNKGEAVASEILRMKQMSNYKEKTQ